MASRPHTHTHTSCEATCGLGARPLITQQHFDTTQLTPPFIICCITVSPAETQYSIGAIYSPADRSLTHHTAAQTHCVVAWIGCVWMNVGHALLDTAALGVCMRWTWSIHVLQCRPVHRRHFCSISQAAATTLVGLCVWFASKQMT